MRVFGMGIRSVTVFNVVWLVNALLLFPWEFWWL